MNALAKTNKLEVSVVTTMQTVTADRIFTQGKEANGSDIGEYSKGYLKTRQKDNYPSSKKVILQATRQMANDWHVILQKDKLGLGFLNSSGQGEGILRTKNVKNPGNLEKSYLVENTYNKDIFKHTDDELKKLDELLDKEIKKALR